MERDSGSAVLLQSSCHGRLWLHHRRWRALDGATQHGSGPVGNQGLGGRAFRPRAGGALGLSLRAEVGARVRLCLAGRGGARPFRFVLRFRLAGAAAELQRSDGPAALGAPRGLLEVVDSHDVVTGRSLR